MHFSCFALQQLPQQMSDIKIHAEWMKCRPMFDVVGNLSVLPKHHIWLETHVLC
jgi:hypothetical protein